MNVRAGSRLVAIQAWWIHTSLGIGTRTAALLREGLPKCRHFGTDLAGGSDSAIWHSSKWISGEKSVSQYAFWFGVKVSPG